MPHEQDRESDQSIHTPAGKVLLISMPFPLPCAPSIQLGSLSAYLRARSIPVEVCHAYLTCANVLGVELYHQIANHMADELFYTHFLFPDHFESHRRAIAGSAARTVGRRAADLDAILEKLGEFNESLLAELDVEKTALVGFTVTYDQLRPSLYMARRLKERRPELKIVFGGALCTGEMGTSLLATFPQVDFVIAGEGEESLAALYEALPAGRLGNIPGLARRNGDEVESNPPVKAVSMETLPVPDYAEYFERLDRCAPETQEVVRTYLSILVEGARGCWWGKCTFCSQNVQYERYHGKPVQQIVDEVRTLVDRHQCHTVCFVDNVQRVKGFRELMTGLRDLNRDLDMFMEIRAGRLEREDFALMRDAGVKLAQIGVEALSNSMLKKIDKGVTTIQNIAAIKYCQEHGIYADYNIIIDYPTEEAIDLEQTAENISFLTGLMPPASVLPMWLGINSPIYDRPEDFNVAGIHLPPNAAWLFPEDVWKTLVPLKYAYTCINEKPDRSAEWRTMFVPWQRQAEALVTKPLLFCQQCETFTTVTDMRSGQVVRVLLTGIEHELYTFCYDIRTREAIDAQFTDTPRDVTTRILDRFVRERWMFAEDGAYLGLAVHLNPGLSPLLYRALAQPDADPAVDGLQPPVRQRRIAARLGSLADIELSVQLNTMPRWLQWLRARLRR